VASGQNTPDPLPEPAALQPDPILPSPAAVELPAGNALTPPREAAVAPLGPVENTTPLPTDNSKWHIHVRLETSVTFDDNIFIQPDHKQSDVYFGITPIVAAGWGTFQADPSTVTDEASRFPQVAARSDFGNSFLLRYAPNAMVFVEHSDQNSVNHDVMLGGRWNGGKLTLDAAGRFQEALPAA